MALPVNRQIEADLFYVMGQRDPAAMIRARSTDPIRASGLMPHTQAGHMTASARQFQNAKNPCLPGGHPHMTYESPTVGIGVRQCASHRLRRLRRAVD